MYRKHYETPSMTPEITFALLWNSLVLTGLFLLTST